MVADWEPGANSIPATATPTPKSFQEPMVTNAPDDDAVLARSRTSGPPRHPHRYVSQSRRHPFLHDAKRNAVYDARGKSASRTCKGRLDLLRRLVRHAARPEEMCRRAVAVGPPAGSAT